MYAPVVESVEDVAALAAKAETPGYGATALSKYGRPHNSPDLEYLPLRGSWHNLCRA